MDRDMDSAAEEDSVEVSAGASALEEAMDGGIQE
jgi:hypothetical protein